MSIRWLRSAGFDLRDRVVRSYILFLRNSTMQNESPPEWYFEVDRLINLRDTAPDALAYVRKQISEAGSDLMVLYLDLSAHALQVKAQ